MKQLKFLNKTLAISAAIGVVGLLAASTQAAQANPSPPANDDVANATSITTPFTDQLDIITATVEGTEPSNPCLQVTHTVWYHYRSTVRTTLHATLSGAGTVLSVFVPGSGGLTEVSCGSGTWDIRIAPDTDYYLQLAISGNWNAPWPVGVSFDTTTSPGNDDVADALPIGVSQTVEQSTVGATIEDNEHPCGTWATSSVWYVFDAATSEPLVATTDGSDYDTVVGVAEAGSNGLPTPNAYVGCNDDAGHGHAQSAAPFSAVAGHRYFIQVAGQSDDREGNLRLRLVPGVGAELFGTGAVVAMDDAGIEAAAGVAYYPTAAGTDVTQANATETTTVDACVAPLGSPVCRRVTVGPQS